MFIAHAPAGYLLTKALFPATTRNYALLMATGLFFSIAPDLDLLRFYLASDRQLPHRVFFTHWPLFWAALSGLAWMVTAVLRKPGWRPFIAVAFANAELHLVLDTLAGDIYWLAPLSDMSLNLVRVPAAHSWWVWNFLLHWTFALELALCLAAGRVFYRSRTPMPGERKLSSA